MFHLFQKHFKNKKGFTLVELIVVIAILGVLAAIAIPRLSGFQDDAKNKAVIAEAKTIASTISVLVAQNYTFVTTDGEEDTGATVFSNAEILGYAGINSGGILTLNLTATPLTSFTWAKRYGSEMFTVTYTYATDLFGIPVKAAAATFTATHVATTAEIGD